MTAAVFYVNLSAFLSPMFSPDRALWWSAPTRGRCKLNDLGTRMPNTTWSNKNMAHSNNFSLSTVKDTKIRRPRPYTAEVTCTVRNMFAGRATSLKICPRLRLSRNEPVPQQPSPNRSRRWSRSITAWNSSPRVTTSDNGNFSRLTARKSRSRHGSVRSWLPGWNYILKFLKHESSKKRNQSFSASFGSLKVLVSSDQRQ